MGTAGSADPVRASLPFHIAVNGSAEVGHSTTLVLAGDATELLQSSLRESMEALGLPPMRELFAKVRHHEIPVYV